MGSGNKAKRPDAIRELIENPKNATNGDLCTVNIQQSDRNEYESSNVVVSNRRMLNELKKLLKDATLKPNKGENRDSL